MFILTLIKVTKKKMKFYNRFTTFVLAAHTSFENVLETNISSAKRFLGHDNNLAIWR